MVHRLPGQRRTDEEPHRDQPGEDAASQPRLLARGGARNRLHSSAAGRALRGKPKSGPGGRTAIGVGDPAHRVVP
ncbi:hypothetical protein [Ornithinimicrobium kibberense]|uniref:hypothetical protein n=1 Tax=Ornithinimicrobium kibberense TaxID=282060 RepID=UPI00361DB883